MEGSVGCGLPDAPYRLRVQTEATVHPVGTHHVRPLGNDIGIRRKFEKTEDFTVRPYSVSMGPGQFVGVALGVPICPPREAGR